MCAERGLATMVGCGAAPLVGGADGGEEEAYSPCSIILTYADQLDACSWVTLPPDAGAPATPDAGEDGDATCGDAGDDGDASEDADGSCGLN